MTAPEVLTYILKAILSLKSGRGIVTWFPWRVTRTELMTTLPVAVS